MNFFDSIPDEHGVLLRVVGSVRLGRDQTAMFLTCRLKKYLFYFKKQNFTATNFITIDVYCTTYPVVC